MKLIALTSSAVFVAFLAIGCTASTEPTDENDESAAALTAFVCNQDAIEHMDEHSPYGQVVAVRASGHPESDYDRFVIEFARSGGVPSYAVRKQNSATFYTDGKGTPLHLKGRAGLEVQLNMASGWDMEKGVATYTGPDRFIVGGGSKTLLEAANTGDFEGYVSWGLGLSKTPCFRVFKLSNPPRLVVDVQR